MNIITEHIPSGSFKAFPKSDRILQAYLGTCVGVALYDKAHNVGGMIHILLPSPPTKNRPENPEKYASTGLPILLQALYDLGATPKTLTATIAGGALVGPLSHQDINLDIGGRSMEIAMKVLENENIFIEKSETGGFFTCTLELNLTNGETSIKPAWNKQIKENTECAVPSRKEILKTIESLTPIPQTALKILRIVQEDNYSIENISSELHKDQVLAARTLQMCNAAMFSGKIKIETLKDALLILGETTLINSVITAAIKNYFSQSETMGYSLCRGGMFFHSLGCAVTSEVIARITKKAEPQTAYTAGLLHDIGKVVLDQYIAHLCPLFFRTLHQHKTDYLTLEKKILGITHCETGGILADEWNFSNSLKEVILHHHNPHKCHDHKHLGSIVYVADLIMSRFNTAYETDKMASGNLESILAYLGLKLKDLPDVVDAIPMHVFKMIV
ncbi:CheD3 [Desulfamplus magnetovallimortis]|uniref:Probable chemoreceptor glutamine deamidase CheD n=1 Tax=Desulfamplus magnetovallimortis TaxID=1246637 RepID=A0A1W1H5I5_9BACT|nr:HDOD domain-containing protein [Desulfamplus magnetovallimortis]SLM27743.1 CheD3 [Desulfamplus magnetovallimortis]